MEHRYCRAHSETLDDILQYLHLLVFVAGQVRLIYTAQIIRGYFSLYCFIHRDGFKFIGLHFQISSQQIRLIAAASADARSSVRIVVMIYACEQPLKCPVIKIVQHRAPPFRFYPFICPPDNMSVAFLYISILSLPPKVSPAVPLLLCVSSCCRT